MMIKGEIPFDMVRDVHPLYGSSSFLLKRWRKYDVYARSGSYSRTDNPREALYSTSSVYLYDYVIVSKDFYSELVYTSSIIDATPGQEGSEEPPNLWLHRENTFRDRPNATTNNWQLTYNAALSAPLGDVDFSTGLIGMGRPIYREPVIQIDSGMYFEIVSGYPRNHFTHKRSLFSLYSLQTFGKENGRTTSGSYKRCQQTIGSTIGEDGLEDGSSPVQATQVSNLNLVQSDNVINQ